MARIELIGVCKTLRDGARQGPPFRIENLTLTIPDGRTLVVLGPSGCGKTTLLRIIAGFVAPDAGRVRFDGVDARDMTPGARRIGMVFQSYALYPHLTARRNILSYFLFRKKTPALTAEAEAKFRRTSELMGVELAHLLDRKPPTLSGGEKQRVAVARCITRDPSIFLLDEPFSNLDQALREKYRASLKLLLQQFGITTVYVTHDHHEALMLADLLAVMDRGRIEQVGTYDELYDEPRTAFVASFLNRHVGAPPISLVEAHDVAQCCPLGAARIGVRPEDVEVSRRPLSDGTQGVVVGSITLPLGRAAVVGVRVDGPGGRAGAPVIHAAVPDGEGFRTDDAVWIRLRRYHVFDPSGVRVDTRALP